MKFSEMPYKRPDGEVMLQSVEELAKRIEPAKSADEVIEIIKEYDRIHCEFSTQLNIAYIRNTIDTRDAFYDAEKTFFDDFLPLCEEKNQLFMKALFDCPYRKEL